MEAALCAASIVAGLVLDGDRRVGGALRMVAP